MPQPAPTSSPLSCTPQRDYDVAAGLSSDSKAEQCVQPRPQALDLVAHTQGKLKRKRKKRKQQHQQRGGFQPCPIPLFERL